MLSPRSHASQSAGKPATTIPASQSTVQIQILDPTLRISNMATSDLFSPAIRGFETIDDMPAFCYLITHPGTDTRILFDLGARVDWDCEPAPTAISSEIRDTEWTVRLTHGIDEVLRAGGVEVGDIDAVIWSHTHWDHVGDMRLFPARVPVIVGPGFESEYLPAWPDDRESTLDSSAWSSGRRVVELATLASEAGERGNVDVLFGSTDGDRPQVEVEREQRILDMLRSAPVLTIGGLPALDFFGDGSFYILSTPGHMSGHLCALARTGGAAVDSSEETASEFVLLTADAYDNAGQIRPSPYVHLPQHIVDTMAENGLDGLLQRTVERESGSQMGGMVHARPFLKPEAEDVVAAQRSLEGIMRIDARVDVLSICAHEKIHTFSWADGNENGGEEAGIRFFPQTINGWKTRRDREGRNLRDVLFWWFLRDYGLKKSVDGNT